jgi:hypothetical protein
MTRKRISQKRAENALAACLPDSWQHAWVLEFRRHNALLRESEEPALTAAEFIRCRLQDLCGGEGMPF